MFLLRGPGSSFRGEERSDPRGDEEIEHMFVDAEVERQQNSTWNETKHVGISSRSN
jgi:hypothetical protein